MPDLTSLFRFPHGNDASPLQVVRLTGSRVQLLSSGTTGRLTIPAGATIIEMTCLENTYLNFGGSGVNAVADVTSHLFFAGTQVMPVPVDGNGDPYTHVAFIQHTTGGTCQVESVD